LAVARALVCIPTYNEAENIGRIVPFALSQSPEIDVLVIDDGSPDGTGDIVEKLTAENPRVHLLKRQGKQGLGTAYIAGFKWGLARDYDRFFEMDADFSHPVDRLPTMLELLKTHDLVIGSRYCDGISIVRWPMKRLLLSYGASIYARIGTGIPVRDLTAGFKGYTRKALESIDLDRLRVDGYGFQIEIVFAIVRKGLKFIETPIVFTERTAGVSKMSHGIIWQALWLVIRLRLRRWFGKS
jgi:dolichol-phosphate mannosyltransferase